MSLEQLDEAKIVETVLRTAMAVSRDGQATVARHVFVLQSTPSYLKGALGSGNIPLTDASIVCSIVPLHSGSRGVALCLLTRSSKAE